PPPRAFEGGGLSGRRGGRVGVVHAARLIAGGRALCWYTDSPRVLPGFPRRCPHLRRRRGRSMMIASFSARRGRGASMAETGGPRIGFLGAGRMATALARGWLAAGLVR